MRTVVYVRVSTLRQAQAQTIEQQLDRLRAWFDAQGRELIPARLMIDTWDPGIAGYGS
jgi:site-specific DNA recombinase